MTADQRRAANYFLDPVLFARHILGDDPWETEIEIFRALEKPRARVAVRGCHASSKTYGAAEFALWFITRFKDGIAVTTAPTDRQVEKMMWGEIHKATYRSKFSYRQQKGKDYPILNLTELKLGPNNFATGFSTSKSDQAVRFHGFHAPHLLFILDEAPGIAPEVLDAIAGAAAGGDVRVLMLGNPTIPGGPFFDAFTVNRETWTTFTIDAYDTPNFLELRRLATQVGKDKEYITDLLRILPSDHPAICYAPRSYLATPAWAKEQLREWGEKSPRWESRVRGSFPKQSEDALISLEWLEKAKNREPVDDGGKLSAGIDVAGPGEDECVVKVRCRSSIIAERSFPEPDPRGEVAAFLAPFKPRMEELNIDSIGIGYGFALHFQDLGYPVNFVNVGEGTSDPEKFVNLKAELYWGLRQRFEAGDVAGLVDETTLSQLATIRYKHNARGQVVIESKDDAKKRGVKSPDRAEATMLCFANRTPGIMEFYREKLEGRETEAVAADVARATGNRAPEPLDEENDLIAAYERAREEFER